MRRHQQGDSPMWFKLLYVGLLFATTSFAWLYSQPLASDIPMHMALAKVYADHLMGVGNYVNSPYHPYFAISSYELPELVLVALILAFGIDTAWKIALSIYALLFPLTVSYLVGKVNPASRWTRLAGFPVTLGYFFHWGFWPYLAGFAVSIWATGISLGKPVSTIPRPMETLARLLTFLCHPIPAFCVGIFDIVRLFRRFPAGIGPRYRRWLTISAVLGLLWLPSLIIVLFMVAAGVNEGGFSWVSLPSQIVQLLRPFYLTREWYEFAIPLIFAALLTYRVWRSIDLHSGQGLLLVSGIACTVVGMLIPRGEFIGSWENGARVIFYGFILIAASWALVEKESKALILGWVISGTAINLFGSHRLWSLHEPSFAWAMDTLGRQFQGYRVIERGAWSGTYGVALGNNLPTWAWVKGIAVDAKNVAGIRKTGPAYYSGLTPEQRSQVKTVVLYYHPYERVSRLWENFTDQPIYFDTNEIYSIQARTGDDIEDESKQSLETAARKAQNSFRLNWID
jgi:hypothetical protein